MADKQDGTRHDVGAEQTKDKGAQPASPKDLDVRAEDADKVKAGRREDPCGGGERH